LEKGVAYSNRTAKVIRFLLLNDPTSIRPQNIEHPYLRKQYKSRKPILYSYIISILSDLTVIVTKVFSYRLEYEKSIGCVSTLKVAPVGYLRGICSSTSAKYSCKVLFNS